MYGPMTMDFMDTIQFNYFRKHLLIKDDLIALIINSIILF